MAELTINVNRHYGDGYYHVTQIKTDAQLAKQSTESGGWDSSEGVPRSDREKKQILYFKCADNLLDTNKIWKVKLEDLRTLAGNSAFPAPLIANWKDNTMSVDKIAEINSTGFVEVK